MALKYEDVFPVTLDEVGTLALETPEVQAPFSPRRRFRPSNDRWAEQEFAGRAEWLDEFERAAIDRYKTQPIHSEELRRVRSDLDELDADVREVVELVDDGMTEITEDVLLFRGTDTLFNDQGWPMSSVFEGDTVWENGFMPANVGRVPPEEFQSKAYQLTIEVPAGTRGIWLPDVASTYVTDKEVLLERGLEMVVREATLDEATGQTTVRARIVNRGQPDY